MSEVVLPDTILYYENESCEHCGTLEAYDPVFLDKDSGITWCLWCALANGDIANEVAEAANIAAVDKKIAYFNERVRKLKEQDDT